MRVGHSALLLAVTLVAASCAAAPTPTNTEPAVEPAVSTVAPQPVPDTSGVMPRFTNDIWPAVSAYNGNPQQNGNEDRAYLKIIVPGMPFEAWRDLRQAVQSLGIVREGDQTQSGIYRDGNGLRLADTALTSLNEGAATLTICYTYTAVTQRTINDQSQAPAASEATIGLVKDNGTWYLYSITNDHVVQGCPASPKV